MALLAAAAAPAAARGPVKCNGGKAKVCQCLLSCPIFGGSTDQCDELSARPTVDRAVRTALDAHETVTECSGIMCIVACAKDLGCMSDIIENKCLKLKADQQNCMVDCSAAAGRTGGVPALIAALAIGLASIGLQRPLA